MKRRDLIRYLIQNGCELDREGKRHAVYWRPETNRSAAVPRHTEITTRTAYAICDELGIPRIEKT